MSRKNIIKVPCDKFDEARFSVVKEQFNLTDKKEICNLILEKFNYNCSAAEGVLQRSLGVLLAELLPLTELKGSFCGKNSI